MDSDSDSGSDYVVEEYIEPDKISCSVNDETADILGNFDDSKRPKDGENPFEYHREMQERFQKIPSDNGENTTDSNSSSADEDEDEETDTKTINTKLSKEQMTTLMRGASKTSRFVLYVTNLNFDTTKDDLEHHFSLIGNVKSIRIPPRRRGGFAFVEMSDSEGFQKAFELHNTELHGRNIKIQISEGGKKKSANKKNILKQKNRKLAEMRNENKGFNKSGKNYDRKIKKEKEKEMLARKRWRKKPKAPA